MLMHCRILILILNRTRYGNMLSQYFISFYYYYTTIIITLVCIKCIYIETISHYHSLIVMNYGLFVVFMKMDSVSPHSYTHTLNHICMVKES